MNRLFYCAGETPALTYAVSHLKEYGFLFSDNPNPRITHLLLPSPAFSPAGNVQGGGNIADVLTALPSNITIVGGNLNHPLLANRSTIDLLQNPTYLAENANITAYCAVKVAMRLFPATLRGCRVLILGWGRIGKCLAHLLKQMGAIVCVAARKPADRAILQALDYETTDTLHIDTVPYRVIFNTIPTMVLPECPGGALKIDLASQPGIGGNDVIIARGLPGKEAPETSGILIADSIIRLMAEKELAV